MDLQKEINWKRDPNNPLNALSPKQDSWYSQASMTMDVLPYKNNYIGYFNGKKDGVNRFGIMISSIEKFDGVTWLEHNENPIIEPGLKGSFDCNHTIDPATVLFQDNVYLYYSALGDGEDCIGLAISKDGYTFEKHPKPIIKGRSPEVVFLNGKLFLFYILINENGGYQFHLATSKNGVDFVEEGPVFTPSPNQWDGFSILTARILKIDDIFIMSYAGDDKELDAPKYFGLAFSRDLINWVKYSKNPIFSIGEPGSWESKAIWFPEIIFHNQVYYIYYEGNNGQKSQIGLAVCEDPIIDIARAELNLNRRL